MNTQPKLKQKILLRDSIVKKTISEAGMQFQNDILLVTEMALYLVVPETQYNTQPLLVERNDFFEDILIEKESELSQTNNKIDSQNQVQDVKFRILNQKDFPHSIRDAVIVQNSNSQRYILIQLQNGELSVLDDQLKIVKSVLDSNLQSFYEKPAPTLEIQVSCDGYAIVQQTDRKLNIYEIDTLCSLDLKETVPIFLFKEPQQNSILDCQILHDWRKVVEENQNSIDSTLVFATITIDPCVGQSIIQIQRLWLLEKNPEMQIQRLFRIDSSQINKPLKELSNQDSDQLNAQQHFIKISTSKENPILSIYTDQQIIFLDQRKLQMINYKYNEEIDKFRAVYSNEYYQRYALTLIFRSDDATQYKLKQCQRKFHYNIIAISVSASWWAYYKI
eukprot:403344641